MLNQKTDCKRRHQLVYSQLNVDDNVPQQNQKRQDSKVTYKWLGIFQVKSFKK